MTALAFSDTLSATLKDSVLTVVIDNPPVNATSKSVRAGLMMMLDRAAAEDDVLAVVLTGAGKTFVGGADIREFGEPAQEPLLPDVLWRIEQFCKPVVAAINGAALGGGCELTLVCHGRIAANGAGIGLPEVKLGLVPGAGGTQRLPRLVGASVATDIIGTGRTLKTTEALEIGLIDRIANSDLVGEARSLALELADKPLRRTGELMAATPDKAELKAAAAKILGKARGQSAPAEAVRLVEVAVSMPLAAGLEEERSTFLRLRGSTEAAALRHVFFAERAAGKIEGLEKVEPRKIEAVGIVGMGLMGSGIAISALNAGYRVVGVEQSPDAVDKSRQRIAGILEKTVQSGRLSAGARDDQLSRLTILADINALAQASLVIEAVFDDMHIKTELFQRLDSIVDPQAILATNTSYLDPNAIAAATVHPNRIAGLHFFSPANIMRLVEVVNCNATAPDVLATLLSFAKSLEKLAIVCGVTEGFIGNRIFSAYRREAEFMLEDGALPHEIDTAMEAYGFPMGLFAVYDMAGLEIAWARRKRQTATRDPAARYVVIADRLCEAGRLGQKAGRGWYAYPGGKRTVDPDVTALIEAARAQKGIEPHGFTADEIIKRLLKAMADEGDALLNEGIAARASDIDLVMIKGYGFPSHKGGPMFVAQQAALPT